jgi:hypothetical protein
LGKGNRKLNRALAVDSILDVAAVGVCPAEWTGVVRCRNGYGPMASYETTSRCELKLPVKTRERIDPALVLIPLDVAHDSGMISPTVPI